jgi:hypothetical protein
MISMGLSPLSSEMDPVITTYFHVSRQAASTGVLAQSIQTALSGDLLTAGSLVHAQEQAINPDDNAAAVCPGLAARHITGTG